MREVVDVGNVADVRDVVDVVEVADVLDVWDVEDERGCGYVMDVPDMEMWLMGRF